MTRKAGTPSPIHLRVGRIVVDAEALGDISREQLHADIGTALTRQLSGQVAAERPTLAQRIAASAAPQIQARLPAKGGRNGAG